MSDLVSIITPTFNSEKFISETIKSVQNQTYQNWELVIVDDASSDKTVQIVQDFASNDSRIKLHKLTENAGAGVARNFATNKAIGRYIAFLDADDLWKENKLETQLAFILKNDLKFTFSFYDCIDEEGKMLNKSVKAPLILTYKQLFFCNFVGNLTAIYDTKYFGKIDITTIRKRQDWILWLTILKKIKRAKVTPESLAFYRIRRESISASKLDLIKYNFGVYRNYHQLSVFSSFVCMMGFLFTQLIVKPMYIKKLN